MPHTILICGNDASLLQTRGLVLRHGGFEVACACTAPAFASIPLTPGINLAVIGHDLSLTDQNVAAEEVWKRWPEAKILYLNSNLSGMEKKSDKEYLSGSSHAPILIAACRQILGS